MSEENWKFIAALLKSIKNGTSVESATILADIYLTKECICISTAYDSERFQQLALGDK